MGQALTLLLTGTQFISSSKRGSFYSQPWGRADMTFPTTPDSPPSRSQGQGQPSAGCLAAQTQALFQKHRLLPLSPSSTKPTCQTACWKMGGSGRGGEMTVRAPRTPELHMAPLTGRGHGWSSLTRVDRVLPEGGVCSGLTTQHPQPAWRP